MEYLKGILSKASLHGKSELNRIDYLDGWRGLAIVSVLIGHFFPTADMPLGRMGVDIFFVLSGMLMSHILFVKRVPLPTFYKRRISRIMPVFFIYVTLICGLSYLLNLSNEHENYFYLLTFLRSYFPATPGIWDTGLAVDHLWSLNVEEHCYIILSLFSVMAIIKGKEYVLLLGLGGGIIVLHYLYTRYPAIAPVNIDTRTEIAASPLFISAGYFLIKDRFKPFVASWMPVLAFLMGIFCYTKYAHWAASWILAPFFFAFAVNHLDSMTSLMKRMLSNNFIRLIGIYSYSIYLWQQPFYYYGVKFEELFPYVGVVFLIVSCLVGVISFYMIENPIRKYLNNNW